MNQKNIDDNASSSKKSPKSPPSFSRESTLDSSLANKFGGDAIKKPPFQSLHKVTKHTVSPLTHYQIWFTILACLDE